MIDNYVTGSGGFIGQNLLRKLAGRTVTIPSHKIASYKIKDFHRFFFLSTYGNMAYHSDENMILQANITDLGSILRQVEYCDSFVFVSSSSVLLPVQTPYSRTKLLAEQMVLASDVSGCVVRPFSVTGCGEQREHLIPTLIRSCLEGTEMDLALKPTHDYVDVEDVAKGLLSLSLYHATGVFEFGSGLATTNEEVLNIVEETTGKKANVRIVDSVRAYDNEDWCCQNFDAKQFGWRTWKSLTQSVKEMVEVYGN